MLKERDTKSNDLACDKVEKAAALARESLCDLENRKYEDLVSTEIICVCDHCLQPAPWAQRGEKADRSWILDLVTCVIMVAVTGLLWAFLEPVPFFISICALFALALLFSFIFRKKVLARIRSKKARKVKEKMGEMPPLFGESASAIQAKAEKTEAYRAVQIPKIR